MNENIECEVEIRGKLIQLQNFISEHKSISAVDDVSTKTSSRSQDNVVKLPKIEIRKFYGDPVNWRTFYDSFISAVDRNQNLSGVEKMNYLSNLVKGEAESTIRGLTLCNDNYKICLKMLQDRYGDPQVLISAHMNKLLNLEKIRNLHDLKALRSLCDQVEAQVRSLNAFGLDAKNYGPMLIPVFLCKIPEELNLIISRKFGKEVSDISIILDTFKLEVEAREKIQFSSSNENVGSISESMSASSLYAAAEAFTPRKCVFCERTGHKPQNCSFLTNISERSNIVILLRVLFLMSASWAHRKKMYCKVEMFQM